MPLGVHPEAPVYVSLEVSPNVAQVLQEVSLLVPPEFQLNFLPEVPIGVHQEISPGVLMKVYSEITLEASTSSSGSSSRSSHNTSGSYGTNFLEKSDKCRIFFENFTRTSFGSSFSFSEVSLGVTPKVSL